MTAKDWLSVVQILVTLVGMYVGPKLAIRYSLKQFRSQKWWELQGETYHRLLENLAIIRHCIKASLDYERHPEYQLGPNKVLEEQEAKASAEVEKIAAGGPYYLSEAASEALNKFANGWSVNLGGGDEDEYTRHLVSINKAMEIVKSEAKKSLLLSK